MYNKDRFNVPDKVKHWKKRAFDRIGNVSQTYKKKMKKIARINSTPHVIQACLCTIRSILQVTQRVPPTCIDVRFGFRGQHSADVRFVRHERGQRRGWFHMPESNIEKSERSYWECQSNIQEKYEKHCEDQFNTPRYTNMSLYNSINTPSYTTSATNMYNKHVPKQRSTTAPAPLVRSPNGIGRHRRQRFRRDPQLGHDVRPDAPEIRKIEKNVSIDHTRNCIYT